MGQPEINAGIPSVTGPMLMLPRIGLARTMELTLTGRMMEAEEAASIGLINYLVPRPEDVMPKTREVADADGAKPSTAMRLNKQRFRQVTQEAFDEAFRTAARSRPRPTSRASRRRRCAGSLPNAPHGARRAARRERGAMTSAE